MNTTTRSDQWKGNAILAAFIAVPLFGCVMAVVTKNTDWLVLLAALIIWMEGFFLFAPVAWFVVICLIEYLK
jgi:hypothetical protein